MGPQAAVSQVRSARQAHHVQPLSAALAYSMKLYASLSTQSVWHWIRSSPVLEHRLGLLTITVCPCFVCVVKGISMGGQAHKS